MTFEEFFTKKKIDLAQLKAAEPELFLEFKSHYTLMGERSFDQVKKFWFNKLRRLYHLKEIPKPAKETIVKEKIASQAEPLSSPTIDQKPVDSPSAKTIAADAGEVEKPATKRKFTPRNIPAKPKGTVIGDLPLEEVKKEDASKPAASYKPKFNPKNIKSKEGSNTPGPALGGDQISNKDGVVASNEPEEVKETKPAFKPRFNMKNIKPKDQPQSTENEEAGDSPIENSVAPEVQASSETDESNKTKPAYKPRFKMKNIQPKEESGTSIPASAPDTRPLGIENEEASNPVENKIAPEVKTSPETDESNKTTPAYKPRFKMKNIKSKEESGISIPASAPEKVEKVNETSTESENVGAAEETPKSMDPTESQISEKGESKPIYKPRFKMEDVQSKEGSGIPIPTSADAGSEKATSQTPESELKDQTNDVSSKKEEKTPQKEEAKPVYKPRFNMKNIKPK